MEQLPSPAHGSPSLRVLFMSTYVPRECGIATYAEDVLHAIESYGASGQVLAMERPGEPHAYGPRVIGTVQEDRLASYLMAADQVNHGWFDVISLQHEYGIYGGEDADFLVQFVEAVRVPIVVTLHTIVQNPTPGARRNLHAIGKRADGIVVMNGLAPEILRAVYGIDPRKISVIHHGSPVPTIERGQHAKEHLGIDGEEVLSTFGLLSPVKGLEYMVQAMPQVVAQRPRAVYYILGQTHPVIRANEGERYRGMLENMAYDLGVLDHVRFIDRYLLKEELVAYLLATDTYVTPYLNLEQVTSGTLAYAMGSGCPLVATPYLHARYLLEEGRGLLVPARDPAALATATLTILGDPALKTRMEATNWAYGRTLY